ncbi:transposase [Actinomyces ruminis]|uniref:transposase n=1 Tax=Actinomyces ruminis TaxID=1937003 RepID=UPI00211F3A6C|nr:transposase [Actinomyces ruminis]
MSYKDRKAVCAALRPIYQAANEEAALEALAAFEASELGQRYPAAVKTFTDAWERNTAVPGVPADAAPGHLSPTAWEVPPPPTASSR